MKPRHLLTILALSPQASSLHDAVNYPVDGNRCGGHLDSALYRPRSDGGEVLCCECVWLLRGESGDDGGSGRNMLKMRGMDVIV